MKSVQAKGNVCMSLLSEGNHVAAHILSVIPGKSNFKCLKFLKFYFKNSCDCMPTF